MPPITPDDHQYKDPREFTYDDCPIIVLVDDLRSFVGWGIKSHTSGNYSHAMTLYRPGMVATQNWLFHATKIEDYMKPSLMLKFWQFKDMTGEDKAKISQAIQYRLMAPWWRRRYDPLGILGQALNIKWIQSPWGMYCSEQVNADDLGWIDRTKHLIKEPNPSDLDVLFKSKPEMFKCAGYYWQ